MARRATAAVRSSDPVPLTGRDPVASLPGVGPKRAEALTRLGIVTIDDLRRHFPRRYDDRRVISRISDAEEGARVQVMGVVKTSRVVRLRGRMSLAEITVDDGSGKIKAVWFGQGYLARAIRPETQIYLCGVVGKFGGLALRNPEYEIADGTPEDTMAFGRIVPVYPLTDGISQRMVRQWVRAALNAGIDSPDRLPVRLALREGFAPHAAAMRDVHFPDEIGRAEQARTRFAYEELLDLQIGVMRERARRAAPVGIAHRIDGAALAGLKASLPFPLTAGQSAAISDILKDMAACSPMARLLQGDVGCGKTLVALMAAAACVDGGWQAALMAPTELLATQHYRTACERLDPLGLRVTLLTGSSPRDTRDDIRDGTAQLVIGTHALFEDATEFQRLGLVIVDEQHRFGVGQRERLAQKGAAPDRLHMTATPIPRTLALTLYGAMDLSIIRDLPPGRSPVTTAIVPPRGAGKVYEEIRAEVAAGRQAYIVCPRVEQTRAGARSAIAHFEELVNGPLNGVRASLLHGRMDAAEKDAVLEAFRSGSVDVLVSTTVVEVGVDAPNATIMVIEDASTFGLTQLHQLRGRVGRGAHPGRCYLLGKPNTIEGRARLDALCATTDGFRIAEEDFALRGPGEAFGEQQAGLGGLRAADLLRDMDLLLRARADADAIISADPALRSPEHAALAQAVPEAGAMSY